MSLIAEQASPTAAVPLERTSFSESLREMARGSTELIDEGFYHSNRSDAVAAHQLESVKGKLVGFDTDPSGPDIMNGNLTKNAAVALGYESLRKIDAENQIRAIATDDPRTDIQGKQHYWKGVLSEVINEAGAVLVKNKKELEQLAKLAKAVPILRPKQLLLLEPSRIPAALGKIPTTILGQISTSTEDIDMGTPISAPESRGVETIYVYESAESDSYLQVAA